MPLYANSTKIGSTAYNVHSGISTKLNKIKMGSTDVWTGILPLGDSLENSTWAAIQSNIKAGTLPISWVGQTKNVTLTTNDTIPFQLVDINTGGSSAYAEYYPDKTADFIAYKVYEWKRMGEANGSTQAAWGASTVSPNLRIWLNNNSSGNFYYTLPTELKNVIISKRNRITDYEDSSSVIISEDLIWLPTVKEVGEIVSGFGTITYNKTYPVFADNTSRIKYVIGTTTARIYWLANRRSYSSNTYCYIDTNGVLQNQNANSRSGGCAIGFRIG